MYVCVYMCACVCSIIQGVKLSIITVIVEEVYCAFLGLLLYHKNRSEKSFNNIGSISTTMSDSNHIASLEKLCFKTFCQKLFKIENR